LHFALCGILNAGSMFVGRASVIAYLPYRITVFSHKQQFKTCGPNLPHPQHHSII
jgi:hypothetical protein